MTLHQRPPETGLVVAVSSKSTHGVRKHRRDAVRLLAGLGVEGDAHLGRTVQHRSRAKRHPTQPNLRQVHLIDEALLGELGAAGFDVSAGDMGENVTTRGIDLLGLPRATRLRLGERATVELTGLRNPCAQLEEIQPGLMSATLDHDERDRLIRKAGVMAIVLADGSVRPGDPVTVELPRRPRRQLEPV